MEQSDTVGPSDKAGKARVFLSYARADGSELAEELFAGLELVGFTPMMDRQDIAAAEDWELRLDSLIRNADTVLFLLSPRSVASPRCNWEVERAQALSKRIVPIVVTPIPEESVPQALRRLNFVSFAPGESFTRALGKLADALRIDLPWIREQTRLGELAARWLARNRGEALLLRGAELQSAELWLAGWHLGAPPPTDRQREFIAASAAAAVLRDQLEARRVEEMAQANASRAEALSLRELAVRNLRRRTLVGAITAGSLATGLSVVGWLYARAARERESERARADEAASRSVADAARQQAMRTDLEGQIVAYATLPGRPAMDESDFSVGLLDQLSSDEVSLGVALARTVKRVITKTGGQQRPYIATDMNADVYFKIAPPSRQRRALVISVDHFFSNRFRTGHRDGDAWSYFLRRAGFEVTTLLNPSQKSAIAAIDSLKLAMAEWDSARIVPVGISLPGRAAPAASAPRAAPAANSFFVFYFSGNGYRDPTDAVDYLFVDTPDREPTSADEIKSYAVSVPSLTSLLRERFAASCLILDTNFPVGG